MTENEDREIDVFDGGKEFVDHIIEVQEYAEHWERNILYVNDSLAIFSYKDRNYEIFEVMPLDDIINQKNVKRSYLANVKLHNSYLMNLINRREVFDNIKKRNT